MTLRPGDLLGLPASLAADPSHQIAFRHVLLLLAALWALLVARARPGWAVLAGVIFVEAVLAFWIAGFGRPYGLFVDSAITRLAAETAVAPLPGEEGFLAGEPAVASLWTRLAASGLPSDAVIALPTLVPLLVVPALACVIAALWRRREDRLLAAVLWLAFSTGEAEAVKPAGFLPEVWSHPTRALGLVAVVAAALGAGWLRPRALAVAGSALAAASWLLVPGSPQALPPLERILRATFDEGPWFVLGLFGLWRGASAAAWGLAVGGGTAFLAGPAVQSVDTWGAHVVYRLGLMLAALAPVQLLLRESVEALVPEGLWRRFASSPERFGLAVLLLVALPASFLARWNPWSLDPIAFASRDPLHTSVVPAMEWIRHHIPPEASCIASPEYAPMVAVLGQRRLVRAPTLAAAADDQRRRRTERMVVAGREPDLARRYDVGCLVFVSGDQGWLGIQSGEELDGAPGLTLGYADRYVRVYRVIGS